LFLQAEAEGRALHRRLVAFTGPEVFQDLIVTEVVGSVDSEIFILVFLKQRKCNAALENEVELCEVFSSLDYSLISNENATVELGGEVADEFFTTLHANVLVFVNKYVFKVI
jgi:hypothetical protein